MNNIDLASVDWARAQFALTAIYHWLFVPLTLGLAVVMGIMETIYYRTGKEFWREASIFWQRLFGVNFAMGVATGIILEFEFGTNWSNYSWFVGDIFGAPLAVEGIVAFFMESTFVAVMFFGWQKVSRGFHLTATWLSGLGATFSAWWILVANSWMQYPIGCTFNPDTMRNEMTSFADVALSPYAIDKFCHTVTSSWIVGAVFVVAVSCYFLLKKKHAELALQSIKVAGIVGLAASLLALFTGDESAYKVAQVQPMKLAAMEALYNGGESQGLTLIAAVNPFQQPDYQNEEAAPLKVEVPCFLSILATRSVDGYVPGINDIIRGYTNTTTGKTELPLTEKIVRGKQAIAALQTYRQDPAANQHLTSVIADGMPYFGYGFIREADEIVPYVPVCFYAFRVMVGLGTLFMAFFALLLFLVYRKDIAGMKWLQWAGIAMLPLAYIASESGWIVAEMGRQPWTIQDMLPTWASVSQIAAGEVMTTFFLFLVLFTAMLVAEISIMCKQIKNY
ncbi:MAG: cytochrome ubiquinol oxidase subunit I [Bacteroidaceae bacterium]|nr:cytochrome ubiquinol oxidase subunit I [Bacteroidaceae bacterium]